MLNDLSEIIAINSIEAERSASDAPFGQQLRNALDWFLNKASYYGLKVGENNGYYGWAEYGEDGAPIIGIPAHIDIVPVGNGWTTDPLTLRIEDGKAYGRGVADDKGPLVAALWALKRIKEEKLALRHRIRLIAGCNEESGSACLKKYAAEDEIPVMSIVPDADFPLINSEKGILHLCANIVVDDAVKENLINISASERINVVPASASVTLNKNGSAYNYLIENFGSLTADIFRSPRIALRLVEIGADFDDFAIAEDENTFTIIASGEAGHAMDPDKADNALWKIFAVLTAIIPTSKTLDVIYSSLCHSDATKRIGVYCEDKESGTLTMSMDMAGFDTDTLSLYFDCRLPICANPDNIESTLQSVLVAGGEINAVVKRERFAENLYVSADTPMIKTLLDVYSKATGVQNPQPLQTGGGTYARELPSAVAFGPTFPGAETNIHNADENIEIEHLNKLVDIYYSALIELDKL